MKIDCTREGDTVVAAAKLLLLLPRGKSFKARRAMGFECKTCSKVFPTFQALGGHRTGHTKPKAVAKTLLVKATHHDCPLCGMRFPTGQALGGHMRRHNKAGAANFDREREEGGGGICLELSLSPPGSPVVKCSRDSLGLRLGMDL